MRIFILIIFMFFSTPSFAGKVDILKIFEQFTMVSAASGKCIKPKKEELTSFLANYQMVSVSTLTEIRKRKPDLSTKQANGILKDVGDKLNKVVYSIIENNGCDDPKIQDLIKRFYMQAAWKP